MTTVGVVSQGLRVPYAVAWLAAQHEPAVLVDTLGDRVRLGQAEFRKRRLGRVRVVPQLVHRDACLEGLVHHLLPEGRYRVLARHGFRLGLRFVGGVFGVDYASRGQ